MTTLLGIIHKHYLCTIFYYLLYLRARLIAQIDILNAHTFCEHSFLFTPQVFYIFIIIRGHRILLSTEKYALCVIHLEKLSIYIL